MDRAISTCKAGEQQKFGQHDWIFLMVGVDQLKVLVKLMFIPTIYPLLYAK